MAKKSEGTAEAVRQVTWDYEAGQKNNGFPWGPHKLPLQMNFEGFSLAVEKSEDGFIYRREGRDKTVEKKVITDKGSLVLSPVEPLNLPAGVSSHLQVTLEQPLTVEPRASANVLLTFPLELSAIIENRKGNSRILDTFALTPPKFTLYGTIKAGLICKYWLSAVHYSVPAVNPVELGVINLSIQNTGARWAEVHKVVLSARGMKLYFNQNLVSLQATMKINSESAAETNFIDEPLQAGMKKALELYSTKLLTLPGKTVMEEGY